MDNTRIDDLAEATINNEDGYMKMVYDALCVATHTGSNSVPIFKNSVYLTKNDWKVALEMCKEHFYYDKQLSARLNDMERIVNYEQARFLTN